MRRKRILPIIFITFALLITSSAVNAAITDYNCVDDGDGAIVMDQPSWTVINDQTGEYRLDIGGVQYGKSANVQGEFTTDITGDPIVWIVEQVDNQTNFVWTDYHIDIGMDQNFTIIGVVTPPDWTNYDISQPVGGQPLPNHINPGDGWVGHVDFYAGTPIGIGQSGSFGVVVSFNGSVAFCTAQVPTPEPATFALLGLGGLIFLKKRK